MKLTIISSLGVQSFDDNFINNLKYLKSKGFNSISTDLWWDHIEYKKNCYDWRTARTWIRILKQVGLKWSPILAFHSCGTNVNDNFISRLPRYIRKEYVLFKSCSGHNINEYVSFWDETVYDRYKAFIRSFNDTFKNHNEYIEKVYISMGPAGELRFPSYSNSFDWKYPNQGKLICYDKLAYKSLRLFMKNKYENITNLNISWDSSYNSWNEITPPKNSERFFTNFNSNRNFISAYGLDILEWYESILHRHFEKMATIANSIFDDTITLGVKLAGVHWKYFSGRTAEKCAGYVDGSYDKLVNLIKKHNFELTITCLEMENTKNNSGIEFILNKINASCKKYDLKLFGENALFLTYGNLKAWDILYKNISYLDIKGFSYLRYDNLFKDESTKDNIKLIDKIKRLKYI